MLHTAQQWRVEHESLHTHKPSHVQGETHVWGFCTTLCSVVVKVEPTLERTFKKKKKKRWNAGSENLHLFSNNGYIVQHSCKAT